MTTPNTDMPSSGAAYPGSGYDPSNPTPYKADPNSLTPPPITAPPPKVSEDAMAPPRSPGALNPKSKAGGIAHMADSILRGVMRGKQDAAQAKAAKTDKLAKGLQFAYQNAANRYVDLVKGGADPNSKEVQEAGMAADAAWQSMMGMYGNYIFGDDKKGKGGKGKSGKGGAGQPENPAELMMSQDPHDKIKGWFMISQKAGPPYKYQAAQFQTPEYKQDRENYKATQQTERDILGKRNEMHVLQNMDPGKLDEHQKARLEQLRTDPELFPEMAKKPTKIGEYVDDKGFKHIKFRNNDGSTFEEMGDEKSRSLASENGKRAWMKDEKGKITSILVDPKTNQTIPGSENSDIMPPASQMDTIRTGEFSFTDDQGILHRIPTTSTTTHVPHGGEGGGHSATGTGAGTGAGAGGGHPSSPAAAAPSAGGPGGRVIGDTGKSQGAKNVRKAAESTRVMADLLSTQSDYMKSIEKNPSAATARQDLALIIASVRAMNPGSVRLPQKELELEIAAGSWGDRFKRQWDIATTGKLPDDQRKQLFTIVKDEVTTRGKHVVEDWKTVLKNEPIPAHLKQFDSGDSGGAPGGGDHQLTPEQEQVLDKYFPKKP